MRKTDEFTEAYIACALWASNDESTSEGGEPFDKNYGPEDLSEVTLGRMLEDCQVFQSQSQADIDIGPTNGNGNSHRSQAGYDFWLTRNGHEAGFWDGDWPEPAARRLQETSELFGECHLVLGDDGAIHHFSG